MILAAAQTKPKRGDIDANLLDHYRLIKLATQNGAQLIVFPELSITGYERENALPLAFTKNDTRLHHLKKLATENNITIIVGAPIQIKSELFIGEFILFPDNTISYYTKQFLHEGEDEFFQSTFNYNPELKIEYELISCAICADIDNPKHPENASKINTPLLTWAGKTDGNVQPKQAEAFYAALRRLKKEHVMLVYENDGHIFHNPKNQVDLTHKTQEWFDYYLKGKAKADWMKADMEVN